MVALFPGNNVNSASTATIMALTSSTMLACCEPKGALFGTSPLGPWGFMGHLQRTLARPFSSA